MEAKHAQIKIANRAITVEYSFEGKDYPATRETPAEQPELIIEAYFQEDKDVTKLVNRYCDRYNYLEVIENYIKYL